MAGAHPFSTPSLAAEDTARLICVALGFWLTYSLVMLWARNGPPSSSSGPGIAAVILLGYSAVGTEILKLGHPIQEGQFWWRLPLNLVGLTVAAVYLYRLRAVVAGRRPLTYPSPWDR